MQHDDRRLSEVGRPATRGRSPHRRGAHRRSHDRAPPTPTRRPSSGRCGWPRRAATDVVAVTAGTGGGRADAARRPGRRARPGPSGWSWPSMRRASTSPRRWPRRFPTRSTSWCVATWSIDRGSGSVPAYLAARPRCGPSPRAHLGRLATRRARSAAERRLDGGRRERLRLSRARRGVGRGWHPPASRRAGCGAGRQRGGDQRGRPAGRPRLTRQPGWCAPVRFVLGPVPCPHRRRRSAHGSASSPSPALLVDREPPRLVRLDPPAAADELLAQLEAWGYR